ncbi:MAG TPA: hypothetical protein VGL81_22340 [Polyangiaceae bacterium]|jgi:hypothetical protein
MTTMVSRGVQLLGVLSVVVAAVAAGCGGGGSKAPGTAPGGDAGSSGSDGGGFGDGSLIGSGTIKSMSISPATATITSTNGAPVTQPYTLNVEYANGTTAAVSANVTWTTDSPVIGAIGSTGVYTANGSLGGVVQVSASYMGQSATAPLTVKLLLQQNPGNVPAGLQAGLQGATAPDASVVWAYPYDGTVWARGLLPPTLQWNGGAATDDYYVHVVSPTFELQQFSTATGAPSSQLLLDATTWGKLTDSTSGPTQVTVARWDGTTDTLIAHHTWTVAPASIRSTIYYWSNNLGRVLRIQPGAAQPDDFANQPPLSDPAQYQQDSCLMTCHTVSADGSTIVSGGGTYGGSFDLKTGQPMHSLGGTWGYDPNTAGVPVWNNIQWEVPAVSPTGKYILVDSMAQNGVADYNGPATLMDLYTSADGLPVATSGVAGSPFAAPAWSPDGTKVAFVDSGDPTGWTAAGYNWQNPPPGSLDVIQFDETKNPMFFGQQMLVATGTGNAITWPTVSPDGQWIMYARAGSFDTRNGNGDLYLASAVTPDEEVRLAKADGDGYPFAAGARDLSWNFEPSFAPVAAGGYFWAVFTSRRTYGNTLTGQAEPCGTAAWGAASVNCAADANCAADCASICACTTTTEVKQLWIVAIDQNPKPGVDPSHAAFHLEGQDETNLAMRGFMSLPPCAADGQSCTSGTDCCGGYCANGADGGAPTCRSTPNGCAQNGDKCNVSSDCCDAASGVTCIAHVCSEPTPQ